MFYFTQQVAPSTKAHLEAQFAFFSDLSKQMFDAVQKINELNIQIAQTALQETLSSTREVFAAQNPIDALSVATSQVQPAAERLRAYQQHLTDIAARTQAEFARTAETHVPEASRTASAVVDEVARRAAEETQKATDRQKAVLAKVASPIQSADGARAAGSVH
ncbi:phasin family protein [Noviherbaspirillum galbum]|uniref:TIGR01841 family phasin n=1 Tax=Noviherbaspirillum galbum TaxID=2709383 RepID=A0A6B3SQG7_9BURK|nr:phasin family protein [Noviherbaspirillum galbum]NEX63007.1 TIGR01841 family phasin [Noviherbaspirillum galbum]